jgi:hypothetical protein
MTNGITGIFAQEWKKTDNAMPNLNHTILGPGPGMSVQVQQGRTEKQPSGIEHHDRPDCNARLDTGMLTSPCCTPCITCTLQIPEVWKRIFAGSRCQFQSR